MKTELEGIKREALSMIEKVERVEELENIRITYLGRKGIITRFLRSIKDIDSTERPEIGNLANEIKNELAAVLEDRKKELEDKDKFRNEVAECIDITLPGSTVGIGRLHPIVQVIDEIIDIFKGIGFSLAEGPDIETEYYNFDALNTPADHPSRDIQDTFYLDNGKLLRTQTSPVQIRVMESCQPPVRIIAPGRCYRRDALDSTHSPVFHQVEGLYVDQDVSLAELKGVLTAFAHRLLGADVKIRFRPHFFPFTEPSVEYDFSCVMCEGKGCRLCKGTGWLEISGAGMVDPAVFEAVGYDPDIYTGYAFGMGVERIAMIKFGVDDIRLFYENDIRFLRQF